MPNTLTSSIDKALHGPMLEPSLVEPQSELTGPVWHPGRAIQVFESLNPHLDGCDNLSQPNLFTMRAPDK